MPVGWCRSTQYDPAGAPTSWRQVCRTSVTVCTRCWPWPGSPAACPSTWPSSWHRIDWDGPSASRPEERRVAAPTIGINDSPARLRPVRIDDKYTATSGRVLLSGIEALVRLTLDQRRLDRARGL